MAEKKKFSYDDALVQINDIVDRLESQDLAAGFDGMVEDVQKALKLIEQCRQNITEAEQKLAEITKKQ